jgi:histidinol phosphatase-like enzyme (inositol monophosphatase family)
MHYTLELKTALDACRRAGTLQKSSRATMGAVHLKSDNSPVTAVDQACEKLVLEQINAAFPRDGLLGEESGEQPGESGRLWVVDPLDGTRPYIRGIPTYSVLLALLEEGVPVVGVMYVAEMEQLCWGARGQGAFLNGAPIHVSTTESLKNAMGSALGFVEHPQAQTSQQLLRLMHNWDYTYGFMDAFSYICIARGSLDCCVNLLDKPWDCAAAACIVGEAGGRFSDIEGKESVFNGSFVITNGMLHEQVLEYFANK